MSSTAASRWVLPGAYCAAVVAFALHALLPWSKIEKQLDLEATSAYLLARNEFIEAAAEAGRARHPMSRFNFAQSSIE